MAGDNKKNNPHTHTLPSQQLDDEEEDRVAVLTAPAELGGLAILKYTTERILTSAPGNVQELRERGLLP